MYGLNAGNNIELRAMIHSPVRNIKLFTCLFNLQNCDSLHMLKALFYHLSLLSVKHLIEHIYVLDKFIEIEYV